MEQPAEGSLEEQGVAGDAVQGEEGWTEMAAFRKEMVEGQRADRWLNEIIDYLEAKRI